MIIIGSVSIKNISGSAIVQFGNTNTISPKTSSKTTDDSGNLGSLITTFSELIPTTSNSTRSRSMKRKRMNKMKFF